MRHELLFKPDDGDGPVLALRQLRMEGDDMSDTDKQPPQDDGTDTPPGDARAALEAMTQGVAHAEQVVAALRASLAAAEARADAAEASCRKREIYEQGWEEAALFACVGIVPTPATPSTNPMRPSHLHDLRKSWEAQRLELIDRFDRLVEHEERDVEHGAANAALKARVEALENGLGKALRYMPSQHQSDDLLRRRLPSATQDDIREITDLLAARALLAPSADGEEKP